VVITQIIEGFTAFGTIAVAVVAIWSDWFRSKLALAKLTLDLHTPEGDPTRFDPPGTRVMFYQLKVKNERPWLSAQNCRVMLIGLQRRGPNGIFQPVPMSVPSQFTWAPSEIIAAHGHGSQSTNSRPWVIAENSTEFRPRLYWTSHNFQGVVGAHEAVRYQLQIQALNFVSSIFGVEVSWDGIWDYVPATMRHHLTIELTSPSPTPSRWLVPFRRR
jgi:hypothetical protein